MFTRSFVLWIILAGLLQTAGSVPAHGSELRRAGTSLSRCRSVSLLAQSGMPTAADVARINRRLQEMGLEAEQQAAEAYRKATLGTLAGFAIVAIAGVVQRRREKPSGESEDGAAGSRSTDQDEQCDA